VQRDARDVEDLADTLLVGEGVLVRGIERTGGEGRLREPSLRGERTHFGFFGELQLERHFDCECGVKGCALAGGIDGESVDDDDDDGS
jgi:hypothetical protein